MVLYRRKRLTLVLVLLIIMGIAGLVHLGNRVIYTASLETRPLVIGMVGNIYSVDPAVVGTAEERQVASMLYEGVVGYDAKDHEIKPLLAKEWSYSKDGKILTLKLGEVKFSGGRRVAAADIKSCWERSLASAKEWSTASLFMAISGTKEYLEGRNNEISGIKTLRDNVLEITFDQPNAAFIYMLTNPIFWVYDSTEKTSPCSGTGPFVILEKTAQHISLVRNDEYHQGQPPISGIEIKMFRDAPSALAEFKNGQLDYVDSVSPKDLPDIRNDAALTKMLVEKTLLTTYTLGFNMNKAPFKDNYLLRRAMNYAIDRETINKQVLGEAYRPMKGVIPPEMRGYNNEMRGYTYDPDTARQLLEQAGYKGGEGLNPLMLSYNKGEGHQRIAESIAQQLGQVGIIVRVVPLEWDYFKKQLNRYELSLFRLEWSADYPDADAFLYSLFHSSQMGAGNFCAYNNNQVDQILAASRAATGDENERIRLIQKAEQVIVDDAPCLWLFQTSTAKMVSSNVNNLRINSMGLVEWYQVELLKPTLGVTDPKEGKV